MLRSMRFTAPPELYDDLLAAAKGAALELFDYCIDASPSAGWPFAGDGNAAIVAIVDDAQESPAEVEHALRSAHTQRTGTTAQWLKFAGSYVFLPSALEIAWYQRYVPAAEALHAAEQAGDTATSAALREELQQAVSLSSEESAANLQSFCDDLITLGVVPVLASERPLTVADVLG